MQTKSTQSMLVHNYRAVLKKCFWANIADRKTLLKSLGSLVSKSAIAGLIVAGMTGLAGNIEVNSKTGSVSISPCVQNVAQIEESEFTTLIEENDLIATMSEYQFRADHTMSGAGTLSETDFAAANSNTLTLNGTPGKISVKIGVAHRIAGLTVTGDDWTIESSDTQWGSRMYFGKTGETNTFTINGNLTATLVLFDIQGTNTFNIASGKTFTISAVNATVGGWSNEIIISDTLTIDGGGTLVLQGVAEKVGPEVDTGGRGIVIEEGAKINLTNGALSIGYNFTNNGTITVNSATSADFNNQTISGTGSIEINGGTINNLASISSLKITSTGGILNNVNLANCILDLSGLTLSASESALSIHGTTAIANSTIINLPRNLELGVTYKIIAAADGGNMSGLTVQNLRMNGQVIGGRTDFTLNSDGTITFTTIGDVYDLVWDNSDTNWGVDEIIKKIGTEETASFVDGDSITFQDDVNLTLSTTISPHILKVTNNAVVVIETDNDSKITGNATVLVESGSLTLNMANDYTGGTIISGGTLVMGHAGALGSGNIVFGGGILKLGVATGDYKFAQKFSLADGTTSASIDLNGQTLVLGANKVKPPVLSYNFINTSETASFVNIFGPNDKGVSYELYVGNNITVTHNASAQIAKLSGVGIYEIVSSTKDNIVISDFSNFEGTLKISKDRGGFTVLGPTGNNANSRFALNISTTADNRAVVLTTDIFLNELSGNGMIRMDWSPSGDVRDVDLEMLDNNTWGGKYGTGDSRTGNFIVGSKGDKTGADRYTLTLSNANHSSHANAILVVNDAIVKFEGSGRWNSTVLINAEGTVQSSIQQTTGIYTGTGTFEYLGEGEYILGTGGMNVTNFEGTMKGSLDEGGNNLNTITVNGTTGSSFENWANVSLANGCILNGSTFVNVDTLTIAPESSITLQGGASLGGITDIVGSGTINLDISSYKPSEGPILGNLNLSGNFNLVLLESSIFNLGNFVLGGGFDSIIYNGQSYGNGEIIELADFKITVNGNSIDIGLSATSSFAEVAWCADWNLSDVPTIAKAKDTITVTTEFSLDDNYKQVINGKDATVIKITGGGGEGVRLIGSANSITREIWMSVEGGSFSHLIGGSNSNSANITGDIHLQLKGNATIGYIVGGNFYGDSNTVVNGDVYISVSGLSVVNGSIIGGSTSAHNANTILNGSTYITINNIQSLNNAGDIANSQGGGLGNKYIIGGSARIRNGNSSTTINGNTNINIDLDKDLTSELFGDFNKQIIGGSIGINGTHNINGNTSVKISASDNVNFTEQINAGSVVNGNEAIISGTTNLEIAGGTFKNNIFGGGSGGGNKINGGTNVVISGGIFNSSLYAGSDNGVIRKGTTLTISGGSFNADVFAGSKNGTINGNSNVVITKGTFTDSILFGGSNHGEFNGDSNITITGSEVSGIVGGSLGGAFTGNTNITVSNTTVTGNIIGSSLEEDRTTAKEITGKSNIIIDGTVTMGEGSLITGGLTTDGSSITIKDVAADSNLASFAGVISGGISSGVDSERVLVLDNIQTELKATIDSFTKISIINASDVTLSSLGGATNINIEENSNLTVSGALAGNVNIDGLGNFIVSGDNSAYTDTLTSANGTIDITDISKFGGKIEAKTAILNNVSSFEQVISAIKSSSLVVVNTSVTSLSISGDLTFNTGNFDFSSNSTKLETININNSLTLSSTTNFIGNYAGQKVVFAEGWSLTIDGKIYNAGSGAEDKLHLRNIFEGFTIENLFAVAVLGDEAGEYVDGAWSYSACVNELKGLSSYDTARIIKQKSGDTAAFIIGRGGINFKEALISNVNASGYLESLEIGAGENDTGLIVDVQDVSYVNFGEIRLTNGSRLVLSGAGEIAYENGDKTGVTEITGKGTIVVNNSDAIFNLNDKFTGDIEVNVNFDFTKIALGTSTNMKILDETTSVLTTTQIQGLTTIFGVGNLSVSTEEDSFTVNIDKVTITGIIDSTIAGKNAIIVGDKEISFKIGGNLASVTLGTEITQVKGQEQAIQSIGVDQFISSTTNIIVTENSKLKLTGATLNNDINLGAGSVVEFAGAVSSKVISNDKSSTYLYSGAANSNFVVSFGADNGFSEFLGTIDSVNSANLDLFVDAGQSANLNSQIGANWSEVSKTGSGVLETETLSNSKFLIKEGTVVYTGNNHYHNSGLDISAGASLVVGSGASLSATGNITGSGSIDILAGGGLMLDNAAILDGNISLSGGGVITIYDGTTIGGIVIGENTDITENLIKELEQSGLEVNYDRGVFGGNLDPYWDAKTGAWDVVLINAKLGSIKEDSVVRVGVTGSEVGVFIIDDFTGLNRPFAAFEIGQHGIAEITDSSLLGASKIIVNGQLTAHGSSLDKVVTGSGTIIATSDIFTIAEGTVEVDGKSIETKFSEFYGIIKGTGKNELVINGSTINAQLGNFANVDIQGESTLGNRVSVEKLTIAEDAKLTTGKGFWFDGKLAGTGAVNSNGGYFVGNSGSTFTGSITGDINIAQSSAFAHSTIDGNLTVYSTGSSVKDFSFDASLTLNLSSGTSSTEAMLKVEDISNLESVKITGGVINGDFVLLEVGKGWELSNDIIIEGIGSLNLEDKSSISGENGKYILTFEDGLLKLVAMTIKNENGEVVDLYDSSQSAAVQTQQLLGSIQSINNTVKTHTSNIILGNNEYELNPNLAKQATSQEKLSASTSYLVGVGIDHVLLDVESINVWGEAIYSYAKHDAIGNSSASKENTFGGIVGFEKVQTNMVYGFFIGGLSSESKVDSSNKTDAESVFLGAYNSFHGEYGFVNVGGSVGVSTVDTERAGGHLNTQITGDYNSYLLNLYAEIGRNYQITDNLFGSFSIGAQYSFIMNEDYDESTGGNQVESTEQHSFSIGADARLTYRFKSGFLEGRIGVTTELLDTDLEGDFRVIDNPGSLYTTQGGELDSYKFIIGVNYTHRLSERWTISTGVLGEIGDKHERLTTNVKFTYSW